MKRSDIINHLISKHGYKKYLEIGFGMGEHLFNQTVLAYGPTSKTFTEENLTRAFGGVLRHVRLGGKDLHEDDDKRRVTVLTDDERPLVLYGERHGEKVMPADKEKGS